MTPLLRRRFVWVLRVAVMGGLLLGVAAQVQWRAVGDALRAVQPLFLVLGVGAAAVGRWLGAYQMQLLLNRIGIAFSIGQVYVINLSAAFYELFLPARVGGGMIRLYKFSQPQRQWSEALAAMAFNRFLETLTLVGLGIVFWAASPHVPARWVIGAVLLGLLAGMLALHGEAKHGVLRSLLGRWPAAKACQILLPATLRAAADRVMGQAARSYQEYRLVHATALPVVGLSVAHHLLGIVSFVCLAHAIGIGAPWWVFGWIRTVVALLTMLPISVAGLGLREGSLVLLLQPFGVDASEAVALSLTVFALALISGGAGGVVELIRAVGASRPLNSSRAQRSRTAGP